MRNSLNCVCLLAVFMLLFLSGCAAPDSEISKTYKIDQETGTGHNVVVLVLDADVDSNSAVRQDAKTDARTKLDAALAQNGLTQQNARDSAGALMEGIQSVLDAKTAAEEKPVAVEKPVEKEVVSVVNPVEQTESTGDYETRFHHTTTGSSDGGKSLVLCPDQVMGFEKCMSDGVEIPYHGHDKERVAYWNMKQVPQGDIVCTKDGKDYRYKADKTIVYGDCE